MELLVVDACVRGEISGTRKLLTAYLKARYPLVQPHVLRLKDEGLLPLQEEDVQKKDALLAAGDYDHPMLRHARLLRDAREIVVAAPYWDWSFPSLLKVYIEHCCAVGLTIAYEGERHYGLCKARRMTYLSTCGGPIEGGHLGEQYLRFMAGVFGIPEFQAYHIENLDLVPARREKLLQAGIRRIIQP